MRLAIACLLVVVLASVPPARACLECGCDSAGSPALGHVEFTTGRADATFYLDDRNTVMGNGDWVFQESNGVWNAKAPGVYKLATVDGVSEDLQTGGSSALVPNDSDGCLLPDTVPDTLLI